MSTRSSWYGNGGKGEIVEVGYDPEFVSYAELVKVASACDCADRVFAVNDAQLKIARKLVGDKAVMFAGKGRADKQPKYYLYVSDLRSIPMTELQAVRVNSVMDKKVLIAKQAYQKFLSPRQLSLLAEIRSQKKVKWPNLVGLPMSEGWKRIETLKKAR